RATAPHPSSVAHFTALAQRSAHQRHRASSPVACLLIALAVTLHASAHAIRVMRQSGNGPEPVENTGSSAKVRLHSASQIASALDRRLSVPQSSSVPDVGTRSAKCLFIVVRDPAGVLRAAKRPIL